MREVSQISDASIFATWSQQVQKQCSNDPNNNGIEGPPVIQYIHISVLCTK